MHIQLGLPLGVLATIQAPYLASGPQVRQHWGAAIMHDPNYNNCIDPSGQYHNSHPGDRIEIGPCYSPPYGPGLFIFNDGLTVVKAVGDYNVCLDAGDDPKENNKVTLETCRLGAVGQQWIYTNDIKKFVVARHNLCLDLPDNDTTPGTQLKVRECDGGDAQYWEVHDFN